jgi:hypothetical protein
MDEQASSGEEQAAEKGAHAQPPSGDSRYQYDANPEAEPSTPYEEPGAFDDIKKWAGDLFGQASEVIMRPAEFFSGLPSEGGLGSATVFAIAMGAVAGILGFVLRVLGPFSAILTTPFAAFASTVVGTLAVHVLAVLAGGKGALEGSYRLAAYMTAFLPLLIVAQVLPYLHIAVAGYAVYALILGVVPVHGIEERRAWSVFGPAGAALLLLSILSTSAIDELRDLRAQQRRATERLERRIEQLRQGAAE